MNMMWILVLFLSVIALVACVLTIAARKRLTALEHTLNRNIQVLRRELDVVNSGAVGVGSRLIQVEKKLNGSIEKQQQWQDISGESCTYNEAASLAEHGVDAEKIAQKCGLSEAEANLMALLKKQPVPLVTGSGVE